MKVLIVEDETAAYTNLKRIFSEIAADVEIIGNTESIKQTVKRLQDGENLPDLIFMDIHLSDGSAFNIFDIITIDIPIVFTTAYDEYAIEAFKVNSIDYLLKPIEAGEVKRALDKYTKLTGNDLQLYLNSLLRLKSVKFPQTILISFNDKLIPVAVADIACFYTTDDKTVAILKNGSNYPYKRTLDSIVQSLEPQFFFRLNKQYVVSKNCIKNITILADNRLLVALDVKTPERIFVSKNRASKFKQWLTD